MKTNRPAFTCRMIRTWHGILGHEAPSRGLGGSHLARCPDCQAYFAANRALAAALRSDANAIRESVPAGLDERVLAAIEAELPAAAPARHPGRLVLTFAAVAAAVALALLPAWRSGPGHTRKPAVSPAPEVAQDLTSLAKPLRTLNASMSAALEKEPLQREVDSVYADARSAMHFLALNFLPDGAPAAPAPTDSPSRG